MAKIGILIAEDHGGNWHIRNDEGKWIPFGKPAEKIESTKQLLKRMYDLGGRTEVEGEPLFKRGFVFSSSRAIKKRKFNPGHPERMEEERKKSAIRLAKRKKEAPEDFIVRKLYPDQVDILDTMTSRELFLFIQVNKLVMKNKLGKVADLIVDRAGRAIALKGIKPQVEILRAGIRKVWSPPAEPADENGDGLDAKTKKELHAVIEDENLSIDIKLVKTNADLVLAIRNERAPGSATDPANESGADAATD